MTESQDRLLGLVEERCLKTGEFTLSTGLKSDFYFDCKRITLEGEGLSLLSDLVLERIDSLSEMPSAIGGLTMGADFIVAGVILKAFQKDKKVQHGSIVRKEAKAHGTQNKIENEQGNGTKIVVVDDVVTTGNSTIIACDQFKEEGYDIVGIITLVDREEPEGMKNIRDKYKNVHVSSIFKASDFEKLIEYRNSKKPQAAIA